MGDYEKRQAPALLGSSRGVRRKRIWHGKRDRGICGTGGNVWNVRAGGIIGAHLDRIVGAVANHYPKIVCVARIKSRQLPDGHAHVRRGGLKLEKIHVVASITTSA